MSWTRSYLSRLPAREELPEAVNSLRRGDHLRRDVEALLDKWDLTWGQYDVLKYVHETEERIGARTGKEKLGDGLPERLDKLREKGYLKMKDHPTDGRRKVAALTSRGLRVLQKATSALEDLDEDLDV